MLADYHCEWNKFKQDSECKQTGQPSVPVRTILLHELQRLGLPALNVHMGRAKDAEVREAGLFHRLI